MRYWKVEMGNGYCGCDEEFLTTTEDNDLTFEDCLDMYVYTDGAAGIDPNDEEFEEYSYVECISDNTSWEEIEEEEYQSLINDEDWEVR
jgi:hypothetical protein